MPITTNFDEFAKKYHDNCQSAPFDKPINIGETESMDMIEILNQEFDVVINENEQLKKEIEQLKGTISCRDYQLKTCKKHYEGNDVHCYSCHHVTEYDEKYVVVEWGSATMGGRRIHCQECIDDFSSVLGLFDGQYDEDHEDAPIGGYKFTWMNGASID